MSSYLDHRFSGCMRELRLLVAKDTDLREACENYEEICRWLEGRCRDESVVGQEYVDALQQKEDLEHEILTLLVSHGVSIYGPTKEKSH